MKLTEATAKLRSLALADGDYAVFGSGPLLVRGVIPETNDLDVIARGKAWDQASKAGLLVYLPDHDITVASFFGGSVTVGRSWAIGDVDIDEVIDTAEFLDELPYARLEHVVAYKRIANRAKDQEHLRLLDLWMAHSTIRITSLEP